MVDKVVNCTKSGYEAYKTNECLQKMHTHIPKNFFPWKPLYELLDRYGNGHEFKIAVNIFTCVEVYRCIYADSHHVGFKLSLLKCETG